MNYVHGGGGPDGAWNQTWRDFMQDNPGASDHRMRRQLVKMNRKFGLRKYPRMNFNRCKGMNKARY